MKRFLIAVGLAGALLTFSACDGKSNTGGSTGAPKAGPVPPPGPPAPPAGVGGAGKSGQVAPKGVE
jgi:hypothetical protein